MHALDALLSKPSQLTVLRVLYHADEPLTGREVERRTGLSNRATMQALEGLVELAAVYREDNAQAYLFSLNTNQYFLRSLKAAFDAEDLFWGDLAKLLRRTVKPKPVAAVATGPLVRDENLTGGRVEITMLFQTGRQRIRAFHTMELFRERLWDRYALTVEPVLLDTHNMNNESYENLWRRIEREGMLLFGALP